jgi:L-lactate dehydrogenase complex protein LldG
MVCEKQEATMTDRDLILNMVRANQPVLNPMPDIRFPHTGHGDQQKAFSETLTAIGGQVIISNGYADVIAYIKSVTIAGHRISSSIPELKELITPASPSPLPHSLHDIELAVIKAHFGVSENGAVWITEELLGTRVLPFICQHLIVLLNAGDIVANMHEAYERIGNEHYGYGTFIAGPSKTADIEQSLVLGAHGARSMTIFLISCPVNFTIRLHTSHP